MKGHAGRFTHLDGVYGVAKHPLIHGMFVTAGEDKMLIVWNATERRMVRSHKLPFRARMPAICPGGHHVAVGGKDSTLGVYLYDHLTREIALRVDGPQGEDIDELKYSPNGEFLAVGNHDNIIYLYHVQHDYTKFKRLRGHTSYITHLDWTIDSRYLQSNCGAYEILYWDAYTGKQLRSTRDTIEADGQWATWTCVLGFPVMGIWPYASDGTDVNAVCVSSDKQHLVTSDDFGAVKVFNFPCVVGHAPCRRYHSHSSHVMNVRFLKDDSHVISVGGIDLAVMQWKYYNFAPENTDNEAPEEIPEVRALRDTLVGPVPKTTKGGNSKKTNKR